MSKNCQECFSSLKKLRHFRSSIEFINEEKLNFEKDLILITQKSEELTNINMNLEQYICQKDDEIAALNNKLKEYNMSDEFYLRNEIDLLSKSNKEYANAIETQDKYIKSLCDKDSKYNYLRNENKKLILEIEALKASHEADTNHGQCSQCMFLKSSIQTMKTTLKELQESFEAKDDKIKCLTNDIVELQHDRLKLSETNNKLQKQLDIKSAILLTETENFMNQIEELNMNAISQSDTPQESVTNQCNICKKTAGIAFDCFNNNLDLTDNNSEPKALLKHYRTSKNTILSYFKKSLNENKNNDEELRKIIGNITKLLNEKKYARSKCLPKKNTKTVKSRRQLERSPSYNSSSYSDEEHHLERDSLSKKSSFNNDNVNIDNDTKKSQNSSNTTVIRNTDKKYTNEDKSSNLSIELENDYSDVCDFSAITRSRKCTGVQNILELQCKKNMNKLQKKEDKIVFKNGNKTKKMTVTQNINAFNKEFVFEPTVSSTPCEKVKKQPNNVTGITENNSKVSDQVSDEMTDNAILFQPIPITIQDNNLSSSCINITDSDSEVEKKTLFQNSPTSQNRPSSSLSPRCNFTVSVNNIYKTIQDHDLDYNNTITSSLTIIDDEGFQEPSLKSNKISFVDSVSEVQSQTSENIIKVSLEKETITKEFNDNLNLNENQSNEFLYNNVQIDDIVISNEDLMVQNSKDLRKGQNILDKSSYHEIIPMEEDKPDMVSVSINIQQEKKRKLANEESVCERKTLTSKKSNEKRKGTLTECIETVSKIKDGKNKVKGLNHTLKSVSFKDRTQRTEEELEVSKVKKHNYELNSKSPQKMTEKFPKRSTNSLGSGVQIMDMYPINLKPLVILERTTKQNLDELKATGKPTEDGSRYKRLRVVSEDVEKECVKRCKLTLEKESQHSSRFMDVKIAQMLNRKLKGDDLERFQLISSFLDSKQMLDDIEPPENMYHAKVASIFHSNLKASVSESIKKINEEVDALKTMDLSRFLDEVFEFVKSKIDSDLAREYIVQTAACMFAKTISIQPHHFKHYNDILYQMVQEAPDRLLICLLSINISVLMYLKQPDILVSFIIDMFSMSMISMMIIARCLPQQFVDKKLSDKYSSFIDFMKLIVMYEFSTTKYESHKHHLISLSENVQKLWLQGYTCSNFNPIIDLSAAMTSAKNMVQEYKSVDTKVKWNGLYQIIQKKY